MWLIFLKPNLFPELLHYIDDLSMCISIMFDTGDVIGLMGQ